MTSTPTGSGQETGPDPAAIGPRPRENRPATREASGWRPIPNRPGYEANRDGRIRRDGFEILPRIHPKGYRIVDVSIGGKKKSETVHKLIALTFLPPRPSPKHQVDHGNGDKSDNRDENLEWVTNAENQRRRWARVRGEFARAA